MTSGKDSPDNDLREGLSRQEAPETMTSGKDSPHQ
jgi:hypothetical protein